MSSLDEVSLNIGALQAQTAALVAAQAAHSSETAAIRAELRKVSDAVVRIEKDVTAFAPVAKKVQKWEQRAIGVSFLSGGVGSLLLAYLRSKGWFG